MTEESKEFIKYIRKQTTKNFIVISSDEEEENERSLFQPVLEPSTIEQQSKKRKTEHNTEVIVQESVDKKKPACTEKPNSTENVFESYNMSCEEIFEKQRISFIAMLDQVSQTYSMNNKICHLDDSLASNSSSPIEIVDTKSLEIDSLNPTENIMPEIPESFSYEQPSKPFASSTILDTNIPSTVCINTVAQSPPVKKQTCTIPDNLSTEELLNMLEIYMFTLDSEPRVRNEDIGFPSRSNSRRTRPQETIQNSTNLQETQKPYTPNKVWFNSTWEDWAQLNPGDVLHVPFSKQEIHIVEHFVNKNQARSGKCPVDFWVYISSMLPGRTRLDCKWFWFDYTNGLALAHTTNVMIRKFTKVARHKSKQSLLQQRNKTGHMVRHAMKQLHWGNMTKEHTISGGSGDAITVAVFQDDLQGVRVATGSLCDENVQYNMPGNLRLWDSSSKTTNTLAGHFTENTTPQQTIWRTVADVKPSHEGGLFFSGSHDGTTKVWRQSTGRLISTLQFHCKPVNQLAVSYWTPGNILASCSNDGTSTIWNIGESGKSGEGSICELDAPFYKNPAVECLEFGHHATVNHLFLGIYNRDIEHTGYVQAFDSNTCKPIRHFDSINGGVSALNISSSGRYVASGNYNRFDNLSGDKHLHIHDMRSNDATRKFFTNHRDVNVVSISPCETFVASGNADKEKGEVVIFDVRFHTRALHRLFHDQSKMNQSLIAPDSSIGIGGLYWMSDSRMVITGGGDSSVKIWNIEGETKMLKSYSTSNGVTSLCVNEECMTIAAGAAGADGIVHVWQP